MNSCTQCKELNMQRMFYRDYDICQECMKAKEIKPTKELTEIHKSQKVFRKIKPNLGFK